MSKSVRGFKWLVGGLMSVSLLGACGAPADGETQAAQEQAAGEVQVSLSVATSSFSAQDVAAVKVTYTNVSSQPVQLLRWHVAGQQAIPEGLLEVSRNGEPVKYMGPHIKRMAPRAEDFVVLQPGQSISGNADLSGLYDLSEDGLYTVSFAPHALGEHNVDLTKSAQLTSNALSLSIQGRPNVTHEFEPMGGRVSAESMTPSSNCSSSRASQIQTAWGSAKTYASSTSSYLNGISSGTARYTTWFGAYSSSGLTTARSHFTKISSALASGALKVDCSCTDSGTYAYVYPDSPYQYYVCGAFWSAPNTGTDSKAGTLIHETSHFTVVAGTDDYVYGQSSAKSLAKSNPSEALFNADNHEYEAENNPAQN